MEMRQRFARLAVATLTTVGTSAVTFPADANNYPPPAPKNYVEGGSGGDATNVGINRNNNNNENGAVGIGGGATAITGPATATSSAQTGPISNQAGGGSGGESNSSTKVQIVTGVPAYSANLPNVALVQCVDVKSRSYGAVSVQVLLAGGSVSLGGHFVATSNLECMGIQNDAARYNAIGQVGSSADCLGKHTALYMLFTEAQQKMLGSYESYIGKQCVGATAVRIVYRDRPTKPKCDPCCPPSLNVTFAGIINNNDRKARQCPAPK